MKTYLRILSYARGLGWYIPQYVTTALLYALFSVVNIALLGPMLEVLFDRDGTEKVVTTLPEFSFDPAYFLDLFNYYFSQNLADGGPMAALVFVAIAIIITAFLSNLFRYLAAILLAIIRVRVVKNIRNDIFSKTIGLDIGYFTNERKGDIMLKITSDVQQIERAAQESLKIILIEPALIIGYIISLFMISPMLTLYALILLPLSGALIAGIAKKLKRAAYLTQGALGRIANHVDEALSGIRLIKAFSANRYILKKFGDEVNDYSRLSISMAKKFDMAGPISEFLGIAVVAGVLLLGGSMVLQEEPELTAPYFITFIIIFSRVLQPAKAISISLTSIQRAIASGDRIFAITDTIPEIKNKPDAKEIGEFKNGIEFNNVNFAYENEPVLSGISFRLEKGKTIALVGKSGGGKSTIADLIPRFYDPTKGEITIDGISLRDCTLKSLRRHMGIVTQQSILFNDTVFNNIAFSKENPTEEEVIKAAKIANAHEFIMEMEDGYQTNVGEDGSKLSGGQRQRLSIARAVMANPPILILDEATSALDSHSEKLVQEAITKLMENRTSLVIAHRLSTIQHADEILVIDKGEIVERGTHDELVAKDGLYQALRAMQDIH
ncbi:MAG: ABC transporter ATP-binding protein [Bacteroidota bacterium]